VLIPRRIVLPIVVTVVALSILAVGFPFAVLPQAFNTWQHHLGMDHWSGAARLFYHVFRFGPVGFVVLVAYGIVLLRRAECDAARLAWWTGLSLTTLTFWALWTLVVLNSFDQLLRPA
jgi:hypothetical protein